MIYLPQMTLGDARKRYFELSGFGDDGGYAERWIKVKVWRIPIWLPNTAGRVRAVKLHDLHHILTEYPTTWRGEAEISSWEIGSGGIDRFVAGWWLDLMSMAQGMVFNPRGVYRGFMRGRRSSNLFELEFAEDMLNDKVGEYRRRLMLDTEPRALDLSDHLAFGSWLLVSILTYLLSVAPFLALPLWIIYRIVRDW
jgi:hypothetical protein